MPESFGNIKDTKLENALIQKGFKKYWNISKNEIEVARNKGDSYFLYLYNRQNQNFIIVKNPYENVIQSNIWAKTAQITEIHRI